MAREKGGLSQRYDSMIATNDYDDGNNLGNDLLIIENEEVLGAMMTIT